MLPALVVAFGLSLLLAAPAVAQLSGELVASGLSESVFLAGPVADDRLFVVERAGTIRIVDDGVTLDPPFLDIGVAVNGDGEGGLLGLVFAPDYATSGAFYVYYLGFSESSPVDMRSIVSRFTVTGDPATSTDADESSETEIFTLDQPYTNHNGGTVAIRDGFLYLGLGDGGDGGDPLDRAQNDASLFGKMLRLDLATESPTTGDWEIWAKGLRNPYRFSFDRGTGDLYIGDVGQAAQEEIDAVPADAAPGLNFGWDVMEGTACFDDEGPSPDPSELPCFDESFVEPIFTYPNPGGEVPAAIVGGSVYRGSRSPSLRGIYFFADATRLPSRLFFLRWTAAAGLLEADEITGEVPVDAGMLFQPAAISEDGRGELYIVGRGGNIHRLVPEPGAIASALTALVALSLRIRSRRS